MISKQRHIYNIVCLFINIDSGRDNGDKVKCGIYGKKDDSNFNNFD